MKLLISFKETKPCAGTAGIKLCKNFLPSAYAWDQSWPRSSGEVLELLFSWDGAPSYTDVPQNPCCWYDRCCCQGNCKHISLPMCSMPSCANATLLKAKCKSSDALHTSQAVKNIDGQGCEWNWTGKHPLSISKHRKIQPSQPKFHNMMLLHRNQIGENTQETL